MWLRLYENSLLVAFVVLFLGAVIGHALGGTAEYNTEARLHHEAPISTLDLTLRTGEQIPIEERGAKEVTHVFGVPVAPMETEVRNPAFDVTPNRYVTAIITERGVARAPYTWPVAPST